MKLLLVRHGQTIANLKGIYQGHLDNPLNDTGKKEAELLAANLKRGYSIDTVFSSPLIRALQTSKPITKQFNLETAIIHDDLKEIDFGKWDGLTYDEIALKYPISKWFENPDSVDIDGGEKWSDFNTRIQNAFKQISSLDHNRIAVVSHAGVIRSFLSSLLNLKGLDMFQIKLENGAFSEIEAKDGYYKINFINKKAYP